MVNILAGVLAYDANYYGADTSLSVRLFNVDYMDAPLFGFLTPPSDSGVGSPSSALSFQEGNIGPATNSIPCIAFYYNHSPNIRHRFMISATSAAFFTALSTGTTLNSQTTLSPVSPYDIVG